MGKIFHHTQPYRRYSEWGCYPMVYCVTTYSKWLNPRTIYACADCATTIKHADPSAEVIGHAMEQTTNTVACEDCGAVIVDGSEDED